MLVHGNQSVAGKGVSRCLDIAPPHIHAPGTGAGKHVATTEKLDLATGGSCMAGMNCVGEELHGFIGKAAVKGGGIGVCVRV